MCAQKLSFDYAHTLHTVRIVHNAHVHRSRVQKGKSCDCINFVRATDPACGTGGFLLVAYDHMNFNIPRSEGAKQPQCPKEKEEAIIGALKAFQMI